MGGVAFNEGWNDRSSGKVFGGLKGRQRKGKEDLDPSRRTISVDGERLGRGREA